MAQHNIDGANKVNKQNYDRYIERWLAGKETGIRGKDQLSLHIRRYLMIKYDEQCSSCDWGKLNMHTGNIPLEVDHIDGDHTNNVENNLTLLCPNCHSLTVTYKGANKGNGRHARAQRYRDGKSY